MRDQCKTSYYAILLGLYIPGDLFVFSQYGLLCLVVAVYCPSLYYRMFYCSVYIPGCAARAFTYESVAIKIVYILALK